MGISLSVGLSAAVSGAISNAPGLVAFGLVFLVLFLIFKYLNYSVSKKEAEESQARLQKEVGDALLGMEQQLMEISERRIRFQKEVEDVLENEALTGEQQIMKLYELSKAGNDCATYVLQELIKEFGEDE